MRTTHFIFLLLLVIFCSGQEGWGQSFPDSIPAHRVTDINPRSFRSHDTIWIYSGICKPLKRRIMLPGRGSLPAGNTASKMNPFLQVSGTIMYDFLYRSFADTPFYQKDFRQHTLQASLAVTVKDRYPFRMNFVVRKSNSPYFKNFLDGGLLFDRFSYYQKARNQLFERLTAAARSVHQPYLDAARTLLEKTNREYTALKERLSSPGLTQQLIEEREKKYFGVGTDSLSKSGKGKNLLTGGGDLQELVTGKQRQLDSLQHHISELNRQIDSMEGKIAAAVLSVKQRFGKVKSLSDLTTLECESGLSSKWRKSEKFIAGIRGVGIGRSVLNYSELTAIHVALTGLNLEYNSKFYMALAAGKIDYGFRDFLGRNTRLSGQHLVMGRVGFGDIDRKAIILSVFTGRKLSYGSVMADTVNGSVPVTGYSIEFLLKKDAQTFLTAELAKSVLPITGRYSATKSRNALFRFSDERNLGLSIKGGTVIHETNTAISGLFRKTGEYYQSFSLFSYNTDQTAWMLKAEQDFFRRRMQVAAVVRRNDFVNPFTEKTFKTTTVFTSLQISVRIPKWPVLSMGYYPGTQLYIIDRNRVRENVYYMLNGTVLYQYKFSGIPMVSSVIYNQYTNRGTDSGFINYSGTNYMLSQSVNGRKLQIQGNFIYTDQQELNFYTVEGNADYSTGSFLRFGAGLKYNRITGGRSYWGGRSQLEFTIPKMGSLQLQYEKSFLPTIAQTLFPVETGRLTWAKTL